MTIEQSSFIRPEPVFPVNATVIKTDIQPARAVSLLEKGGMIIISNRYSTAKMIQDELDRTYRPMGEKINWKVKRELREELRSISGNLLVGIKNHRLTTSASPSVSFLKDLYPELDEFYLPYFEIRDLIRAYEYYVTGVQVPVLGYKIHPFYGTYAPDRMTHLELFATWLSSYKGERNAAIDVGCGSGIIALMLAKAKFSNVSATDINPNAVESLRRDLEKREPEIQMNLSVCDLLGDSSEKYDLIVFNPPWMYGETISILDRALYFDDDLFERFFNSCAGRLNKDGRIIMLFSNIIRLVQPDFPHPVDAELTKGRFELVNKMQRRIVPDKKGRRTKERVEIWELKHK